MRGMAEERLVELAPSARTGTVNPHAGWLVMGLRTLDTIDTDLGLAVTRRSMARCQIPSLEASIVNDTREIDRLLAERSDYCAAAIADELMAMTGDGSGRR